MNVQDKAAAIQKAQKAVFAAAKRHGYNSRQAQQAIAKVTTLMGG